MHVMQCYPAIKKSKLLIHATGGKSQKYFTKWNKPDIKHLVLNYFIYIKYKYIYLNFINITLLFHLYKHHLYKVSIKGQTIETEADSWLSGVKTESQGDYWK